MALEIICDNVRSALNVGSIFRSADAFQISRIWLCGITARPPPGYPEKQPWERQNSALGVSGGCRCPGQGIAGEQYTVYRPGANQSGCAAAFEWSWDGQQPVALLVGNKVNGLSDEILLTWTGVWRSQFGIKHSLNVAVASRYCHVVTGESTPASILEIGHQLEVRIDP